MSVDSGTRSRMRRVVTGRYKPATGRYSPTTGRYRPATGRYRLTAGKNQDSGESRSPMTKRKFKYETKSGHSSNLAFYGLQPTDSNANITLAMALSYAWAMLLAIIIPHLIFFFFVILGFLLLPIFIIQKVANHSMKPKIHLYGKQIS